uniref:Ribosomal protein S10 n=1 Tax=Romanomermis culicivorax TaxID=13658 RepID=A0A915ITK7_ROMCU
MQTFKRLFQWLSGVKGHLHLPFSTERNGTDRQKLETFSLKIHFQSERTTAMQLERTKMIDSNLQPNRTLRKFMIRSVTCGDRIPFHSVPSEKANFLLIC